MNRAEPTPAQIKKYGERGSCIPGSKFYREYCKECGEPLRVTYEELEEVPGCKFAGISLCERCNPPHKAVGTSSGFPIDDVTGYEANAVRALEGD